MRPGDPEPLEIVERLLEVTPADQDRARNYLLALRDALRREGAQREEANRMLAEYEQAYSKLTSPANRIGLLLQALEGDRLLVALGDTEYVAQADPSLNQDDLLPGSRVLLNEAFAVVGIAPETSIGRLHEVTSVRDDGRVAIGESGPGAQGRLIDRSDPLREVPIKPGDSVRLDPAERMALEHFPGKEGNDYFLETVPELPWDKVGGQSAAIDLIRETIEQPLLHPELFARYDKKPIKGILLYGPPGCGKTLIGKATAHNLSKEYSKALGREVKEYFMFISGPKILNMWLGETERMVRDIFRIARDKAKEGYLVFIFMDEAESVLRTRSAGRYLNISNTVVPQFCAELDGMVALENVVLILTSNRPDYIDPAVLRPERIDRKVKVSRPDRQAALQILDIYLHAGIPIDPELVGKYRGEVDCARRELIEGLVERLWATSRDTEFLKVFLRNGSAVTLHWKDLLSGALLKSVVDRAKDHAIRRQIAEPDVPTGITAADLAEALATEFKENEVFPQSEVQDDWLKLLDYDPDNVASVKPIGRSAGDELVRRSVI